MPVRLRQRFAGHVLLHMCAIGLQGGLSLLALPLATQVLGPEDYGIYALAASFVAFMAAAAEAGTGIVLAHRFGPADAAARGSLVATVLVNTSLVSFATGAVLVLAAPMAMAVPLPMAALALSAAMVPLRAVMLACTSVFMVANQTPRLSLMIAVQASVSFAALLASLFAFGLGGLSLFVAAFAGAAGGAAVGLFFLVPSMRRPSLGWLASLWRVWPVGISSGAADGVRTVVEASTLTHATGPAGLGLLTHARLYHGLLLQGTNAVASVTWSHALSDARVEGGGFERLERMWTPVHLGLTLVGLGFAFLGPEFLAFLTNGKFTSAAPLLPIMICLLLLQNSGKAAMAVAYAHGHGARTTMGRIVITVLAIALMPPVIGTFGIPGALGLLLLETLAYRAFLGYLAGRLRRIPFQDHWVWGGCLAIAAATGLCHNHALAVELRAAMLAVSLATVALAARRTVASILHHLSALIRK